MDFFLKTYGEEFRREFTSHGFKKKRNTFVRIEKDVLQNFRLHRSQYGWSCTIEFGIIPLCYPLEKEHVTGGLGGNNLRMFEDSMEWWEYDRNSDESIRSCIQELIYYTKRYLIPFFERGNSCSSAYHEICSFERSISKPFGKEVHMADYWKYCMALKAGDYDSALAHIEAVAKQCANAYDSNKRIGNLTPEYVERMEGSLREHRREIEALQQRDIGYISRFISENEAYSLANLASLGVTGKG